MTTHDLLLWLELLGVLVFSLTGALVAVRSELDVFGALVLAGVTGLGGGAVRDLLIGATPPAALADWRYLLVPAVATVATFYLHVHLERMSHVVSVLDAAGLALFCVTGSLKAVQHGLPPLSAAVLGLITGVGGGVVRDVLGNRRPQVFRGELYATPAMVAALMTTLAIELHAPLTLAALPAVTLCFTWRYLAMRRGWRAPLAGRTREPARPHPR